MTTGYDVVIEAGSGSPIPVRPPSFTLVPLVLGWERGARENFF